MIQEGLPDVSKLFVQWQELLSGYRRNEVSLWRLIGVSAVLDPDSWWRPGQDQSSIDHQEEKKGAQDQVLHFPRITLPHTQAPV